MPLTRATVTIASRVMLPVDVVFFAGVGLSFTLTPLHRLRETPALRYLDDLVGMTFVGTVFLISAGLLLVSLVDGKRRTAQMVLAVLCVVCLAYAGGCTLAAIFATASWSAWLWPWYVAMACWASLLSLQSRET